jgi:lipopolysaccharide/colanic/teichoic acid biosynthesis glycosyltransferase
MSILVTPLLTQPEVPASARPSHEAAVKGHETRKHWAAATTRATSHGWYPTVKVALEFALAVLLLIAALPLVLLSALLVKLTSRGPVFYSQIRLGLNGKPFRIFKIRTMAHNCERDSGARWATANDPRITPVGKFLRATHLDELPQLWNVLRGDMSLVGPRPERPEFVPNLEKAIPHYRDRLDVRPGVTGLAQVQLPADTDISSVRRKLAYDLYYIRQMNFWLDLRLIVCTALHVFRVPYSMLGKLFRLPGQQRVESDYQERVEATRLLAPAVAS